MSGSTDPSIILQAGAAPLPDLLTQQQIASQQMTLGQQQKAAQAQNALRALYKNPANLTPSGGLTGNALRQVMQIDPATGLQMSEASSQVADAQTKVATDQRGYITDTILTPSMEAYQNALKTMPPQAALSVAQQVYASGLQTAAGSGVFSQDQVAQMPKNFDPVRVGANVQSYSDFVKQQQSQEKIDLASKYDAQRVNVAGGAAGIDPNTGLPYTNQAPAAPAVPTAPAAGSGGAAPPANPQPGATPVNNPFNLRPVGQSTGFMQYPTQGAGVQAGVADLKAQGKTTLQALISKYSPPNENNTVQFVQNAAAFTGFAPNQLLDMNDPATLATVTGAILKQEGGLAGGGEGSGAPAQLKLPQPRPNKPWEVMALPDGTQIRYQPDTGAATTLDGSSPVDVGGNTLSKPAAAQPTVDPNDPTVTADATAMASYQMPPLSGYAMSTPRGQALMADVMKINPEYDATQYAAKSKAVSVFDTGQQGNSVRSFNVGIAHLNTLQQLADALNNGNIQAFNKIGNQFAQQTGSPAPTNFDAAKAIVGDEIIKAIVGGGGALADRENAQNQIDNAKSPAQLAGVIQTYKKLMAGQLGGLQQQFTSSTGLPASVFQAKLYPDTLAELQTDQTVPAAGTAGPGNKAAAQPIQGTGQYQGFTMTPVSP